MLRRKTQWIIWQVTALHNDYSERAFQLERSGQWVKGKSCDTFAPFGPFLATPDEIEDVNNLKMWLKVNGETMQSSNSSNLHYKIPFLLSYVSQFMTLLPGDIISTGTPPGVGLGMDPPVYLKAGDLVELGIDQLGFILPKRSSPRSEPRSRGKGCGCNRRCQGNRGCNRKILSMRKEQPLPSLIGIQILLIP
jgi:fumarylacetoacetate (FAA) hydrolase family protein